MAGTAKETRRGASYLSLTGMYALHETIGEGGFGKVKRATHLLTGKTVAIKIIRKSDVKCETVRFTREVEALKLFKHKRVCKMLQHVESTSHIYIVMEYCPEGELLEYIISRKKLPESEARILFKQIVDAVGYIHSKQYSHRDLKPENLILDAKLGVKLIDFGLCGEPRENALRETYCGSKCYSAPEVVKGKPYIGEVADVWSMGVILYSMLCGQLPFDNVETKQLYARIVKADYKVPKHLSRESVSIIATMLTVDTEKRATINSLLDHPWMFGMGGLTPENVDFAHLDEECIEVMAKLQRKSCGEVHNEVAKWQYDYSTATYLLLKLCKDDEYDVYVTQYGFVDEDRSFSRQSMEGGLDDEQLLTLGTPERVVAPVSPRPETSAPETLTPLSRFKAYKNLGRPLMPLSRKRAIPTSLPSDQRKKPRKTYKKSPITGAKARVAGRSKPKCQANEIKSENPKAATITGPAIDNASQSTAIQCSVTIHTAKPASQRAATVKPVGVQALSVRISKPAGNQALSAQTTKPQETPVPHTVQTPVAPGVKTPMPKGMLTPMPRRVRMQAHKPHGVAPASGADSITSKRLLAFRKALINTPKQAASTGETSPKSSKLRRSVSTPTIRSPGNVTTPQIEATPARNVMATPARNVMATPARNVMATTPFRARLAQSIEKSVQRMRMLMTPRARGTTEYAVTYIDIQSQMNNVSTTSCTDPFRVLLKLTEALEKLGVKIEQEGFTLKCRYSYNDNKKYIRFKLEVCLYRPTNVVAIRRLRLQGDSWAYKRIVEQIINL